MPVAAPEQQYAGVKPAGQVVAEAALSQRARPDDDSLLLGNPSYALSQDESKPGQPNADNLLVERPQHALSYNAGAGGPNWVAWHVSKPRIHFESLRCTDQTLLDHIV